MTGLPGAWEVDGAAADDGVALRTNADLGHVRTILLATDLSPVSKEATRQAIALAGSLKARLLVVNVIDQGRRAQRRGRPLGEVRAETQDELLDVVGQARDRGVESTFLLWTGEPGRSVVAAAAAERVDLVVVGTRGLDRAGRFLLGSVSDHVAYHAACPVLVVRSPTSP